MSADPTKKNNVTISGNPDSPTTLIFSHGFGTDQSAWSEIAAVFEPDYRVIRYDNVGAGKSDPEAFSPNKYDSLKSYASDLADICDALHIHDAILVAHSVSGMIGILASFINPAYFKKMILVGASARYRNDTGYQGGFEQDDLDGLYHAMSNNYFAWVSGFAPMAMGNPDKPQLAESFAQGLIDIRPDIAQSVARVIFQSDYREVLDQVTTPTLIVQSQHDIAVPFEAAQYLHQQIKNSQLVIVKASGHLPHISAPAEVTRAISNFIC